MLFKKLLGTGKKRESPVLTNESIVPHNHSQTFVKIKIKEQTFKVVVDSGAEVTLMSLNMARELKIKIIPDKSTQFIAANKQPLESIGWSLIEINFGQVKIKQKVTIIKGLSTNMLIGTDCLKNNGFIINYERNYLQLGKIFLNLITQKTQDYYHISTTSEITVEPRSSKIEFVRIPDIFEGDVYFEHNDNLRNLSVYNGLLKSNKSTIPIIFVNKMNFKQTIGKGRFIGTIESVDEFSVSLVSGKDGKSIEKLSKSNQESIEKLKVNKLKKAKDLVDIDSNLTEAQKDKLFALLDKYNHIFSKHANDLGYNDIHKFEINTEDAKPIKSRQYRVPYAQQEKVNKLIEDMFAN